MNDFAQCFPVQVGIGIGEYDEWCFHELHSAVEGGGFSLSLGLVEDGGTGPVGKPFVGVVVAAVRDPEYLQFVCGVIQRQAVLHLFVHHVFLIVSCDEECDFGQFLVSRHGVVYRFAESFFNFDQNV